MLANPDALENAESLVRKPASVDSIQVKDCRVGSKTRPNCGNGVLHRPIQESCHVGPVGFILEIRGAWFCAGNNETIERSAPEIANIAIGTQVPSAQVPSRNQGQREECQLHR